MVRTRNRTIAAVAVAGALAATALPALAQDDGTEESTTGHWATDGSTTDDRTAPWEPRQQAFAERLAAELGLDVETVDDALTAVREDLREEHRAAHRERLQERLDQAIADGEITQEQADAILAAHDAGAIGGHGLRGHLRGPRHHHFSGAPEGDSA